MGCYVVWTGVSEVSVVFSSSGVRTWVGVCVSFARA